jgi:hypothetical protein
MFWEKGPLGEKAPGSQKDTPGHHGTAAFWPAYFRISLNILATNDCHMVSGGLLELSQYNIGSIYSWKFDSIPAITSPNLLGIVLLSLTWLKFGVAVDLSAFKYLKSVNEVLQIIKCPISNIQSQFLTLLHFVQTQFNVR